MLANNFKDVNVLSKTIYAVVLNKQAGELNRSNSLSIASLAFSCIKKILFFNTSGKSHIDSCFCLNCQCCFAAKKMDLIATVILIYFQLVEDPLQMKSARIKTSCTQKKSFGIQFLVFRQNVVLQSF